MPLLRGDERPLLLVAPQPINAIFRQVCSAPTLLALGAEANADKWSLTEVADTVKPLLVEHAAESDVALTKLVDERRGQRRQQRPGRHRPGGHDQRRGHADP